MAARLAAIAAQQREDEARRIELETVAGEASARHDTIAAGFESLKRAFAPADEDGRTSPWAWLGVAAWGAAAAATYAAARRGRQRAFAEELS